MERRQSDTRNVYIGLCCFCLLALLWLFGTVPVSAAAFNGSWKFYTTDTVTNDSLDLLGMHGGVFYNLQLLRSQFIGGNLAHTEKERSVHMAGFCEIGLYFVEFLVTY